MRQFWTVLAVLPSLAAADEFVTLTGDGISAALTDRVLVYAAGETQDFRASGATLYNAGQDSWGTWAVRGDRYCSQWPPSDGWTCYEVALSGITVRFISADGSFSDGTYTN
ncbi:MAG: hypothetical protein ABF288_12500 [Octadecabacter sp.]